MIPELNRRISELGDEWFLEWIPGKDGKGISETQAKAIESVLISMFGIHGDQGNILERIPSSLLTNKRKESSFEYVFTKYLDLRVGLPNRGLEVSPKKIREVLGTKEGEIVVVPINPNHAPQRLRAQIHLANGLDVPEAWRAEWCLRYWNIGKDSSPKYLIAVTKKNWGQCIVGSYRINKIQRFEKRLSNIPKKYRNRSCCLPIGAEDDWGVIDNQVFEHPLDNQNWINNFNEGNLCGYKLEGIHLMPGPIYI